MNNFEYFINELQKNNYRYLFHQQSIHEKLLNDQKRIFQFFITQSIAGKPRDIQQKYRLGPKKIWFQDKLPPLQVSQMNKQQSNSNRNYMQNLNQQLIMKRIQRDHQLRASIDTCLNDRDHLKLQRDSSVGDIDAENLSVQEYKMSPEEEYQHVMLKTKPILKKNLIHFGSNSILIFKSVEINIIDQDPQNGKSKINNTLYVPIIYLKDLLPLGKKALELKIMENLTFNSDINTFIYRQLPKSNHISPNKNVKTSPKQDSKQQKSCEELFPEEIHTSLFSHEKNKDYSVVIRLPTIEYQIPSKQFVFIKTLQRTELSEYLEMAFNQWDVTLLKHLMQFRKFVELLRSNTKESVLQSARHNDYGNSVQSDDNMNIYYLSEKNGIQIRKYTSYIQLRNERFLKQSAKLKGCFDRDGKIGIIQIKSFVLKIKGLNNEVDIKEQIKIQDWKKIICYMKTQLIKDHENPKQFIDKVHKKLLKNGLEKLDIKHLNLAKYDKEPKIEEKTLNSARNKQLQQFFKTQKRSKMIQMINTKVASKTDERYLLELDFPLVTVFYDDQKHTKALTQNDCLWLIEQNFKDWKKFLMNLHFRMELNIGNSEPLPRIAEDKKGEDDVFSEGDPKERYPPANEVEKQKIEVTRGKLSQWFPY